MKVIRCYAASANAVNAQNLIQDLLLIKFEALINETNKKENECNLVRSKKNGGDFDNDW